MHLWVDEWRHVDKPELITLQHRHLLRQTARAHEACLVAFDFISTTWFLHHISEQACSSWSSIALELQSVRKPILLPWRGRSLIDTCTLNDPTDTHLACQSPFKRDHRTHMTCDSHRLIGEENCVVFCGNDSMSHRNHVTSKYAYYYTTIHAFWYSSERHAPFWSENCVRNTNELWDDADMQTTHSTCKPAGQTHRHAFLYTHRRFTAHLLLTTVSTVYYLSKTCFLVTL